MKKWRKTFLWSWSPTTRSLWPSPVISDFVTFLWFLSSLAINYVDRRVTGLIIIGLLVATVFFPPPCFSVVCCSAVSLFWSVPSYFYLSCCSWFFYWFPLFCSPFLSGSLILGLLTHSVPCATFCLLSCCLSNASSNPSTPEYPCKRFSICLDTFSPLLSEVISNSLLFGAFRCQHCRSWLPCWCSCCHSPPHPQIFSSDLRSNPLSLSRWLPCKQDREWIYL